MKSGMKALYLTFALIAASGCLPAHAAQANERSPAASQLSTTAEKAAARASGGKAAANNPADEAESVVSINTGSAEDLARILNGVGLKKAQSIVSYREEFGPFKELDQLQEVPGIGEALVERNRQHIKL